MAPVTIQFTGPVTRDAVLPVFFREDSGFETSIRQPLNSNAEIALSIVGVILSAAQLAVAIWQVKHTTPSNSEVSVEFVRADGTKVLLRGKNVSELQAEIETVYGSDEAG